MLNFNQAPYWDDFTPTKDFYRILFKPSVAVQTRELTQAQTILQNQFKNFGDSIFKNGSMVIPGHLTYDNKFSYVKLLPLIGGNAIILSLVDPTNPANALNLPILIQGSVSGIIAQVISIFPAAGSDPDTLYIKYLNSGLNGEKTFTDSEYITLSGQTANLYQVATNATGFGSAMSITQGVYYINGIFSAVNPQTLILDKYDNTPSYRVGLTIQENIITSLIDPSLLSNATGTSNYAAPGADRYQIILLLASLPLNSTNDTNFIDLAHINSGQLQFFVEETEYSIIGDAIADNIYNINGNFTVHPFKLSILENINNIESLLSVGLQPGKAYVNGQKIKTIATTYVDVPKARTTEETINGDTRAYLGNYCLVSNLFDFPTYDSYVTIGLYTAHITSNGSSSGSQIGTADMRAVEYFSGTIGSGAVYKFYLFNINMNSGYTFDQVQSFYITNGGSLVASTGNILSQLYVRNASKSFTIGETVTDSDSNTAVVIEWDSVNNLLTIQPSSTTEIVVGTTITGGTSGATASVASSTKLFNINNNILIYPLPQQVIDTIRASDNSVQTTYNIRKTFTTDVTALSASFTVGPNEVFAPFTETDYIAAMEDGTDGGTIFDISGSVVFSGSPSNTVITFTTPANGHVKLSATILRQSAQEKTKTLVPNAIVTFTATTLPLLQSTTLSLGKPDIYQLISVVDSNGNNITDNYTLDNGQRDNRYSIGNISLNIGAPNTNLALTVTFSYFNHGQGDYFSVDSYNGFINDWYENIPIYTSNNTGLTYVLRDCYDFRPRENDNGVGYNTTSGDLVKVNSDILADFQYYLPRADKVYLNFQGEFIDIEGTPSLSPQPPDDPKDGMVLYVLNLPAYTFNTADVTNQYIENKRYTMRDIGKLEGRISNLEYYTSLNLLEQQANTLQVQDASTGLNRYKNGFLVDNFSSFSVSDCANANFHCSMDLANQILRPEYYSNAVNLTFDQNDSTNFEYQNLKPQNTLLSLPYNELAIISQTQASDVININPYAIYAWIGNMLLTPPSDTWQDTNYRPVILINNDIGFNNITDLLEPGEVIGTMYDAWETDWTGYTDLGTTYTYGQAPSVTNVAGNPATNLLSETQTVQETLNQSRTAVTTSIVPQVVSTQIQNKVVNVTYATYIRNNQVLFQATGLKPRTQVYPFFDIINVSAYCKPQGSIDGTYTDTSTTLGQPLITDNSGKISGWFNIPDNPSTEQFLTGTRVFTLIDSQNSPTDVNATTFATATYTASGILDTDQETIISTRVPEVVQTSVTQTQQVTMAPQTVTYTGTTYIDPLAQSFLIDDLDGGAFITSVDIYFYTKDPSIPVTLQIREMENGLPSQTLVPLSSVTLNPANIGTSTDGSVATTFSFVSPIYLQNNTEYCLVLISNSNQYNVYIATLGHTIINSDRVISQQPYNGVLFESKNSSTWTPNQTSDLTFVLRRAQFNTSVTANILLTDPILPVATLGEFPFQTVNTSDIIRIFHPNHGMYAGSTVTITIPQSAWSNTYNGIPVSNIVPISGSSAGTANFIISNVTFDSYTITVSSAATASGLTGPSGVTASQDMRMDALYPLIQQLTFSNTSTNWFAETTTTQSINGSQSPYNKDATFTAIPVNSTINMNNPKAILSNINEQTSLTGSALAKKSLVLQAQLSSTVDNLSPIIDLTRVAVITISNRCGNATPQNTNVQSFDELDFTFTGTDISFSSTDNSINSISTNFAKLTSYGYITISGSTGATNDVNFSHAILITSVSANKLIIDPTLFTITTQLAGPSITIKFFNNFIDEKSPTGGSQASKYLAQAFTVAQPADSLQLYLETLLPSAANVTIYYRIVPVGSNALITTEPYSILPIDPSIITSPAQNAINFQDYDWFNDSIGNYVTIAIKIVMNTVDSTQVPQFQSLRALALSL